MALKRIARLIGLCATLAGCSALDSDPGSIHAMKALGYQASDYPVYSAREVFNYFMPPPARNFTHIRIIDPNKESRGKACVIGEIWEEGLAEEFLSMVCFQKVNHLTATVGWRHDGLGTARIDFCNRALIIHSWDFAHGRLLYPGLLTPQSEVRIIRWLEAKGYPFFLQEYEFERSREQDVRDEHIMTHTTNLLVKSDSSLMSVTNLRASSGSPSETTPEIIIPSLRYNMGIAGDILHFLANEPQRSDSGIASLSMSSKPDTYTVHIPQLKDGTALEFPPVCLNMERITPTRAINALCELLDILCRVDGPTIKYYTRDGRRIYLHPKVVSEKERKAMQGYRPDPWGSLE